eukprot:TRINITY_DN50653_c0_g1_i1.p1 TRINITY_DN50653_c0_g1~~TRINITY_DN50653_c0_g1_i1.p1  ORF type:complete len:149 (+),score=16.66 TRINITY_DN50653_c0_g1_i1:220-666(+)
MSGVDVPDPYENISCTQESLASIKEFSKNAPVLIISGQGGSDTRAAQEVVQHACTHWFGTLDPATHDSWACRFAAPGSNYADPFVSEFLEHAGRVDYAVDSLPEKLQASEREARRRCQERECSRLALAASCAAVLHINGKYQVCSRHT